VRMRTPAKAPLHTARSSVGRPSPPRSNSPAPRFPGSQPQASMPGVLSTLGAHTDLPLLGRPSGHTHTLPLPPFPLRLPLQEAGDEAGRRAARERFHAVRAAYDVLRCPDRRRAYDRGEPLDSM
jgi:hypothetical protein